MARKSRTSNSKYKGPLAVLRECNFTSTAIFVQPSNSAPTLLPRERSRIVTLAEDHVQFSCLHCLPTKVIGGSSDRGLSRSSSEFIIHLFGFKDLTSSLGEKDGPPDNLDSVDGAFLTNRIVEIVSTRLPSRQSPVPSP